MTEEFKKRQEKLRKLVLDFEMNLSQNKRFIMIQNIMKKLLNGILIIINLRKV